MIPFKFWKKDRHIKRPNDVLKDNHLVFDILNSELSSSIIIDKLDSFFQLIYHNINKIKFYNIIYIPSSTFNCYYSLYRTSDKQDAKSKFIHLTQILIVIHKEFGLNQRNCILNTQILENAVQFILKYRFWLPIHFAARFGLSNFFKLSQYQIYVEDYVNTQSKPLQRTPIMLAILSNDLETIKSILNLNPDISLQDKRGSNILHFAAIYPPKIWSPVFRHCMLKGISNQLLSKRNNKYVTPIHFICYSKNFENMVDLLKIGLTIDLLTIEPPYIIKKQIKQQQNELNDQSIKKINDDYFSQESTIDKNENERIVLFTNEMISDLKFEDMIYGGTPLHWCQHKRTLERLIEYEFNINSLDLNHETAIIKCIKDNRFKCLVILLNAGADPNLFNKQGNTSLHEAVLSRDIAAVQACICWDAKLDLKNKRNETARHLASSRGTPDDQLIVHILNSVGAKRCDKDILDCKSDCSYSGLTNGKKYSKWPNFENEKPYFPFLNQQIIEKKLQELIENDMTEKKDYDDAKKVRMICFDGGGTKGLISVQMLIEIEKFLKRPLSEYFEWMSGTSTGSLITAMLSLNIPLRNIKVIYYMLKDKIMVGPRPYDSGLLECLLQGILGENVKMGQINKKIIITGTLADRTPCQLHLFRSYPSPNEILNLCKESVEKLLNLKKEEIYSKNLCKIQNTDPHSLIIELSNILSNYQSSSQNISVKRMFNGSTETVNEPKIDLKNLSKLDIKKSDSNLNLSKDQLKKLSKILPSIFAVSSNTTLAELNESSNLDVQDDVPIRHKFNPLPNYLNQKLWLACRSSGAAPTFFRAKPPFIDGGIISNNPFLDTLTDFINYNSALKQHGLNESTKELDLVISIGTGKSPVIPTDVIDIGNLYSLNFLEPYQSALQAFNLAQEMITMATQTDAHVVQRGQAWCNSINVPYFRLNPPLSENLQLNVIEEVEIVNALWETKAYMYNQRSFIEMLARLLERHSMIS